MNSWTFYNWINAIDLQIQEYNLLEYTWIKTTMYIRAKDARSEAS